MGSHLANIGLHRFQIVILLQSFSFGCYQAAEFPQREGKKFNDILVCTYGLGGSWSAVSFPGLNSIKGQIRSNNGVYCLYNKGAAYLPTFHSRVFRFSKNCFGLPITPAQRNRFDLIGPSCFFVLVLLYYLMSVFVQLIRLIAL